MKLFILSTLIIWLTIVLTPNSSLETMVYSSGDDILIVEDGLDIDVGHTYKVDDHWLDKCIDTIKDDPEALNYLIKCIYIVGGIQQYYPGGIERDELDPCLKLMNADEYDISENSEKISIIFSDDVSLTFQYGDGALITSATINVMITDYQLEMIADYQDKIACPLTVNF